jgi:chromatin remodeling complex protein RSC6
MSSQNTSVSNTMSTSKKSVKKVTPTVAESTPAPVATSTPAPTPATDKKTSKKASVAALIPAATPAPVATPAAVAAPAPAESASESNEPSLADEIKTLQDQLTSIRDGANAALTALKRVAKRAATEIKEARKNRRRARAEPADGEPRKPSNFEIPVPISDDLSVFLGGGKNNKMSRAQVTSAINKYLNDHKLRSKHDITPDAPLRKLLGIGDDVKLTLFNIQTYLSKHYPKPAQATKA